MTLPGMDTIEELLRIACRGDANGIKFGLDFWEIIHFWDDLIDGDEVTKADINRVMQKLLLELPRNPLYTHPMLLTSVSLCVSNWMAANEFEGKKMYLDKAYMMRAFAYNVIIILGTIIGGQDWGNEIAPVVWAAYGENLQEFIQEVQNA